MNDNDKMVTEWVAWRRLCEALQERSININTDEEFASILSFWSERLVELRIEHRERIQMNKRDAITRLLAYDHMILSPEEAAKIAEPFGIRPVVTIYEDNRDEFKGITVYDGVPGVSRMRGVGAHVLAEDIAHSLNLAYPRANSVGSRLRNACFKVREYLDIIEPVQ